MQTRFTERQLAVPEIATANDILRSCVHCGFCLATCPTYAVLGDERDSPRGRIYLIKEMLENERPADAVVTRHLDRCLSCLSCMTTCPSGVDYMHLIDFARVHVEETHRRPMMERLLRGVLSAVLPRPALFRLAMSVARVPALLAPGALARLLGRRLGGMLRLARRRVHSPSPLESPQVVPAQGRRRLRVALLPGCVQCALAPEINEAAVRVLTRHGCEVVVPRGVGCCGALSHHLGKEDAAKQWAARNLAAFGREIAGDGLAAIVVTASGCGTMLKDYGTLFKGTPHADAAADVALRARDISEVLGDLELAPAGAIGAGPVAYHSACSLQHGQRIEAGPKALLTGLGFDLRAVPDGHLCCGSAGTYNLLQPTLAAELGARKAEAIESTGAAIIAAGNIGCMVQIGGATRLPVVHTVELADWATGGPRPGALVESA